MIPVYTPYLTPEILKYAHDAIDSGWLSMGKYNELATEFLQDYLGVKHVLLCANGTVATHLVAKALQFRHPEIKTILAADNVYVAAWNSFLFDQKYNIKSIPANHDTWNMDESYLSPDETSAILAVHNMGNPVNVIELKKRFPKTPIVEDACEGFFGKYEGYNTATQSVASSLSFFGNKNITCGEGGAVATDDSEVYTYIRKLCGQGQTSQRFIHDELGYNYRLTNIAAAVLYGQLKNLDEIKAKKQQVWQKYQSGLQNVENIKLQKVNDNCEHSMWMFGVQFTKTNKTLPEIQSHFQKLNIETRPMFYPMTMHRHLFYNDKIQHHDLQEKSLHLNQTTVIFPSYPNLTEEEQNHVILSIIELAKGIQ
jgi:perosamine synthetase